MFRLIRMPSFPLSSWLAGYFADLRGVERLLESARKPMRNKIAIGLFVLTVNGDLCHISRHLSASFLQPTLRSPRVRLKRNFEASRIPTHRSCFA